MLWRAEWGAVLLLVAGAVEAGAGVAPACLSARTVASCCGAGFDVSEGGAEADTFDSSPTATAPLCTFAYGGGDDVTTGAGGDIVALGEGDDRVWARAGDDVVFAGAGDDMAFGDDGADHLLAGQGADRIHGSGGNDSIAGEEGEDWLHAGPGNDEVDGGAHADFIDGHQGDDALLGSYGPDHMLGGPGADTIVPGSGADRVEGGPGDDTVIVYHVCELGAGERLHGGGGKDVLRIPVPLEALAGHGVVAHGFETVEVDATQAHESDCHCFHGALVEITDDGVQCQCDPGWVGERCDTCETFALCVPPERMQQAVATLLSAAPPELQDHDGARHRTAVFAFPMLLAEVVVVGRPSALVEVKRPTHSATFLETFTDVQIFVDEIVRGPALQTVDFTFNGRAEPEGDEELPQEGPNIRPGVTRIYAVHLRAGHNHLSGVGSDWRVNGDGEVELGFYNVPMLTVREALKDP
jgi:hypothetical protein